MTPAAAPPPARSLLDRLRAVLGRWVRILSSSSRALSDDTINAVGDRVDRLVERVIHHPSPVATRAELTEALENARSGKGSAASIATLLATTRLARRSVRLGARRIPMLAAVTGTATALSIFAAGFRELRMLASHLVHRARADGVEVTPAALRSVTLQLYLRPDVEPRLDERPTMLTARIATRWVRSSAAEVLPLVPDDLGRPAVHKWVDAAAGVDIGLLSKG